MISEYFFPDKVHLFSALQAECKQILSAAIDARQSATMLVSGGGTPAPLYKKLSTALLDWQSITVALVDERWVDADHPGSNAAFIIKNLLQENAAAAKFVSMKTPEKTPGLALASCEKRYRQLSRPFDLSILGMGTDGHMASLFPQASGLVEALDINHKKLCVAINANHSEVTGELTERMSLSLFGLLESRQVHLLITGDEKLAVYKEALASDDLMLTPVSALLQQERVPVKVYWAP